MAMLVVTAGPCSEVAFLFVVVHFVHKHAQEKSGHEQHEHDHAQTHQAIVGRKQVNQHFHGASLNGFG
jgi:hypothetical protein